MITKIRLLVLAMFALSLSGCGDVRVVPVKEAESKRSDCSLSTYASTDEIKRPYETVCLIDSQTGISILHKLLHKDTVDAAIKQAKGRACLCGADAIIIQRIDSDRATKDAKGSKGIAKIRAIRFTN